MEQEIKLLRQELQLLKEELIKLRQEHNSRLPVIVIQNPPVLIQQPQQPTYPYPYVTCGGLTC